MMNRGLSKKPGAGRPTVRRSDGPTVDHHQPWPWVQARVASSKAKASFSRGDTDQHTANNDSSTRRLVDWDGNGRASRCVVFGGEFQSNPSAMALYTSYYANQLAMVEEQEPAPDAVAVTRPRYV